MFKVSLPTKSQLIHTAELAVVSFLGSAIAVWIRQPNPFSKAAVIVAITTGVGALAGLAKGVLTTL